MSNVKLTKPQERRLEALRRQTWILRPNEKLPKWAERLIAKGVARPVPGLFDDCPQAIEAV